MKKLIFLILMIAGLSATAQQTLNAGDLFPDITLRQIVNAPVTSFNIDASKSKTFYILNMWGTWCSPCIPEMDVLAKLQAANPYTIQVIAISDDSPARLQKYLAKKPSKIWLASDTSFFLYKALGLSYVGQSAIVDSRRRIVAVVKTDSINQRMVNDLLKGKKIFSSAELKEQAVSSGKDLFGVDSTISESFTARGYMKGQQSMGRRYNNSTYNGRRVSYINSCITMLYKEAFQITSSKQVTYEINEKDACNFDDKSSLYCIDLLVKSEQKDSIYKIMQQKLLSTLPVKGRIIEKVIPVYVLKLNPDVALKLPLAKSEKMSYGFSGRGFDGTGVTVSELADLYLSNEFELPVVNETGLNKRYDIKTTVDVRNKENIIKSISDIGFILKKAERKMNVLVLYK